MVKPNPQKSTYDVIVVGSGPAGSTLAYELARQEVEVAILERDKLPRPKLCGGGITLKAARLLPFDLTPIVHCTISRLILLYRGAQKLVIEDGHPLLYTSTRQEFDLLLAEQAAQQGASLLENQSVCEIVERGDRYLVRTQTSSFEARVLVGADGANSTVARSQGLRSAPYLLLALEGEIPSRDQTKPVQQDTILVDWGGIRNGYGWVFPKRQHATIGVGAPASLILPLRGYYHRMMDRSLENPGQSPGIKGHHLPVRKPGMPIQKKRVALIGDAAGLVEPFTGEGIYYAIRSAQIAAEEILDLDRLERRDLETYEKRVDAELMPEIITGQVLSGVFATFPRISLSLFGRSRDIQQYFCCTIRGEKKLSDCGSALGGYRVLLSTARWLANLDNRLNIFSVAAGPSSRGSKPREGAYQAIPGRKKQNR